MAIRRTVWGPKVPTLKGTEASLSYLQCFLYLVSSINVSIFHTTRLDTFWTDIIYLIDRTLIKWRIPEEREFDKYTTRASTPYETGESSGRCVVDYRLKQGKVLLRQTAWPNFPFQSSACASTDCIFLNRLMQPMDYIQNRNFGVFVFRNQGSHRVTTITVPS